MRLVIQRSKQASVTVDGRIVGQIDKGLVILCGIEHSDETDDADWLVNKVLNMRIFGDDEGKMNLSIAQVEGQILFISQFTLHASTKKGNRPSFVKSARPEKAIPLYEYFIEEMKNKGVIVQTGQFGANMSVSIINDGPVTIIIDSKNRE